MKAAYNALKPSDCYDWITPRDLQRIVVLSWKRAKAECHPRKPNRWISDGVSWSSPSDFSDSLQRLLVLHVQAQAHAAGIPGNEYAPAQLSLWYTELPDVTGKGP